MIFFFSKFSVSRARLGIEGLTQRESYMTGIPDSFRCLSALLEPEAQSAWQDLRMKRRDPCFKGQQNKELACQHICAIKCHLRTVWREEPAGKLPKGS